MPRAGPPPSGGKLAVQVGGTGLTASSLRRRRTEGKGRNREGGRSSVGSKDENKTLPTSVSGNPRVSEVAKHSLAQAGVVVCEGWALAQVSPDCGSKVWLLHSRVPGWAQGRAV